MPTIASSELAAHRGDDGGHDGWMWEGRQGYSCTEFRRTAIRTTRSGCSAAIAFAPYWSAAPPAARVGYAVPMGHIRELDKKGDRRVIEALDTSFETDVIFEVPSPLSQYKNPARRAPRRRKRCRAG
jgi:hypothetical protein